MKNLSLVFIIIIFFAGCFKPKKYALYEFGIDGDAGRKVTISYLDRWDIENDRVVSERKITKEVELPYASDAMCNNQEDIYLTITTVSSDTTTKAILLFIANDTLYNVLKVIDSTTNVAYSYFDYYIPVIFTKDSAWRYLKYSGYPCYIEFNGGTTTKTISIKPWLIQNHWL